MVVSPCRPGSDTVKKSFTTMGIKIVDGQVSTFGLTILNNGGYWV